MATTFMDEQKSLGNLGPFAALSPDRMPSVQLCEGDLQIFWSKLTKLVDMVNSICKDQSAKDILQRITAAYTAADLELL